MNRLNNEKLITSLAIIKVNWDTLRKDYIENFVPFVIEALRLFPQHEVSLPELQNTIFQHFGLEIPQPVLKTILGRVKKRGFIKIENKVYKKINGRLEESNFERLKGNVLREHEALIQKMIDFFEKHYNLSLAPDEASRLIIEYIQSSGMKILGSILSGEPVLLDHEANQKKRFKVGSFVYYLLTKDPLGLSYLEKIIKGSALYTPLFFPDIGKIEQHFTKVDIYLDTPFLLKALGYTGKGAREYCRELLDLLYGEGANLKVFEKTVHEIEGILHAAIYEVSNKGKIQPYYGECVRYFIESGYKPSDIEILLNKLRDSIRSLRVEIVEPPAYSTELCVDEKKIRRNYAKGSRL